jgi:tight adherence protein B
MSFSQRTQRLLAASSAGGTLGLLAQQLAGVELLSICVATVCFAAMHSFLVSAQARKQQSNAEAMPAIIESVATSIDSGASLLEAFENLALETVGEGRLKAESLVAVFESDRTLEGKVVAAKEVFGCREGDLFLEMLLIAARKGDNELTRSLISLAGVQRAQHGLTNELVSRQGWILGSARLAQASPWIVVLLLSMRPETAVAFSSPAGSAILLVGLAMSFVAQRFIVAGARMPQANRNLGPA